MLTRRIDATLDAISACREGVPFLRDLYRADTPERAVLADLAAAIERADKVLLRTRSGPKSAD